MKKKYLATSVACLLSATFMQPVYADTRDDLIAQVKALTKRIDSLENKGPSEKRAVTKGELNIPGTQTSIKFGGYLQADMIHDTRVDTGPYFNAGLTSPSSANDSPNTQLQARQSRFNIKTTTDVGTGKPLVGFLEMDFMGDDNSTNEVFSNSAGLRLRHAYIKYDKYLIGQYWSNFQDFVGYPILLDISSPAGRVFVRQTQFRYSAGNWALSLENPETQPISGFSNQAESLNGIGEDTLPDLVVSWRGGNGGAAGLYQASAVVRELGINGTFNGVSYDQTHTGWGTNLAGRWKTGNLTFKANAAYGKGIGRYINNGWANDVRLNADGSSSLITSYGLSAAMEVAWNPALASTFSYGYFENEDDLGAFGTESLATYRANLRWTPIKGTMVGAEVMHAERDYVDGRDGDNTRLQLSVRRSF